jgi:16S rRNA (adenine1518-N6/adenine1519-N6)-dimethyltransferase
VYLVQREVAERLTAPPGGKEYGALTVNVGAVATVEILFHVPAGAFRPPPKVDSAAVRITPRSDPAVAPDTEKEFREFVQSVFTMRRKQMQRIMRSLKNLDQERATAALVSAGIDPTARPETLDAAAFARLLANVRT